MKKIVAIILFLSSLVSIFANKLLKIDVVDDFGDLTGESYITYSEDMSGTYTNSYGKGNLLWNFRINTSSGEVTFILKEDGKDSDVSTSSDSLWYTDSNTVYHVVFKQTDGTTEYVYGKLIMSDTLCMNNIEVYDTYWGDIKDWSCFDFFTSNSSLNVSIKSEYGSYYLENMELIGLEELAFSDELYNQGIQLMKAGKWQEAISVFETYKADDELSYNHFDTETLVEKCKEEISKINYREAKALIKQKKYDEAIEKLRVCDDYSDSKKLLAKCLKITGNYLIGDVGPTGGYIFYDCDADNESGNADGLKSSECGWRYLEAASTDLSYKDSSGHTVKYPFGYYRTSSSGSNSTVGTGTAIGTGKANTDVLVKAMGETTYPRERGADKETYAAKACSDYSITVDGTVYDDWFLPSKDELNLMYENLYKKGLGSFASNYYWSSSEDSSYYAWRQSFGNGSQYDYNRGSNYYVRPVRAFK